MNMVMCLIDASEWCMANCKGKDENDQCILFLEDPERFIRHKSVWEVDA